MAILTLVFLQLGTMARRCAVGHLPSRNWVSATSSGEVSLAKARGVEASGNPGDPPRLDGRAQAA
jgi:hypothetical protein